MQDLEALLSELEVAYFSLSYISNKDCFKEDVAILADM